MKERGIETASVIHECCFAHHTHAHTHTHTRTHTYSMLTVSIVLAETGSGPGLPQTDVLSLTRIGPRRRPLGSHYSGVWCLYRRIVCTFKIIIIFLYIFFIIILFTLNSPPCYVMMKILLQTQCSEVRMGSLCLVRGKKELCQSTHIISPKNENLSLIKQWHQSTGNC